MVLYLNLWKALRGPPFGILCTTSVETVEQRMAFTWLLLCHFHNKVSTTAEFIRLITFKGKCEADLHCSSGPVQIPTFCLQFYLRKPCSKPLHHFSYSCAHQPAPLPGRSTAICSADLTRRPAARILLPPLRCKHGGCSSLPAVPHAVLPPKIPSVRVKQFNNALCHAGMCRFSF